MAPLCLAVSGAGCNSAPQPQATAIRPVLATEPVANDADDPAIWVHPTEPAKSLIFGTNKVSAPAGSLVVFTLDGKIRQAFPNLDRPNNVDVEYGLPLAGAGAGIAVLTERLQRRLRVFRVAADGSGVHDVTSMGNTRVFADRQGDHAEPMGIGLYKRPSDGAIYAIVAPKDGPTSGYLGQYRLEDDGRGRVRAVFVRYFGAYSGGKEIEAVAVDDALGHVYYADESVGIRKYHADPDRRDAAAELAFFGQNGYRAHREGIAIYAREDGTGYIVCTDQIAGNSEYRFYRREGEPGRPHDHSRAVLVLRGGADSTDGLEISARPLGPRFPRGLMAAMNSGGRNFVIYDWRDVEAAAAAPPGR